MALGRVTKITPAERMTDIITLKNVYGSLSIKDANTNANMGALKVTAVTFVASINSSEVVIPKTISPPNAP